MYLFRIPASAAIVLAIKSSPESLLLVLLVILLVFVRKIPRNPPSCIIFKDCIFDNFASYESWLRSLTTFLFMGSILCSIQFY